MYNFYYNQGFLGRLLIALVDKHIKINLNAFKEIAALEKAD
jgi:hypothetical protein